MTGVEPVRLAVRDPTHAPARRTDTEQMKGSALDTVNVA